MELSTSQFAEVRQSLTALQAQRQAPDKRRFNRLPVQSKVILTDANTTRSYAALTQDLSQTGMGVIQSIPVQAGQRLVAALPKGDDKPVYIICTVVEARELAERLYAVHLQFDSIPPVE